MWSKSLKCFLFRQWRIVGRVQAFRTNYRFLDRTIPVPTLWPRPHAPPLRTSTPTVLNCSALTSTCPPLPHSLSSPPKWPTHSPRPTTLPPPLPGRTHRHGTKTGRRTTPTRSFSVQCFIMSQGWVRNNRPMHTSRELCTMAPIVIVSVV